MALKLGKHYHEVAYENPSVSDTYLGRNGTGKCFGVNVQTLTDKVMLSAVNSKGGTGSCLIDVPKKHVRELCIALQVDVLKEAMSRLPIGMIPLFVGDDGDLKAISLELLANPKKED